MIFTTVLEIFTICTDSTRENGYYNSYMYILWLDAMAIHFLNAIHCIECDTKQSGKQQQIKHAQRKSRVL